MASTSSVFPPSEAPLACEVDVFNGIRVSCGDLDVPRFGELLQKSLDVWKEEGRTGVWLFIPTELAALIPVACALNFDFHHAKPGRVALIQWLPDSTSMIPKVRV